MKDTDLGMSSLKVFDEFNNVTAGFSAKPDKSDVLRKAMTEDAKTSGRYVVRPCLVHGKDICCITEDFLKQDAYIEIEAIDGLVTDVPGVRLTSTHGDCVPLYAYDPVKNVIGLAHAGWKGTALGIARELADTMTKKYGCRASDICAYIGPAIDRCHFEFGKKEAEEYFFINSWTKDFAYESDKPDKLYLDLKGINRYFFELAGVGSIEISSECTYCLEGKYYSYRRCGDTHRMLAYIEINKEKEEE